jgi:cathepsin L
MEPDSEVEGFDWPQKLSYEYSIYDQGQCGSCWTFAALSTIEHHLQIYKNFKIELSEQQLVDCSRASVNAGCNGGNVGVAYDYIRVS